MIGSWFRRSWGFTYLSLHLGQTEIVSFSSEIFTWCHGSYPCLAYAELNNTSLIYQLLDLQQHHPFLLVLIRSCSKLASAPHINAFSLQSIAYPEYDYYWILWCSGPCIIPVVWAPVASLPKSNHHPSVNSFRTVNHIFSGLWPYTCFLVFWITINILFSCYFLFISSFPQIPCNVVFQRLFFPLVKWWVWATSVPVLIESYVAAPSG